MVRISSRHRSTSSSGTPVRADCNTSPQRNQQRNVAIESAHRQPPVVLINDKDWRQTREPGENLRERFLAPVNSLPTSVYHTDKTCNTRCYNDITTSYLQLSKTAVYVRGAVTNKYALLVSHIVLRTQISVWRASTLIKTSYSYLFQQMAHGGVSSIYGVILFRIWNAFTFRKQYDYEQPFPVKQPRYVHVCANSRLIYKWANNGLCFSKTAGSSRDVDHGNDHVTTGPVLIKLSQFNTILSGALYNVSSN